MAGKCRCCGRFVEINDSHLCSDCVDDICPAAEPDMEVHCEHGKRAQEMFTELERLARVRATGCRCGNEIPQDADLIKAEFVHDSVLTVSWYGNPEDAPEWWGKDLGFAVVVGDGQDDCYYGKRVADVINELSRRLTVEKCRTKNLEIALRRLVQKSRGVHVLGDFTGDEEDDRRAAHELHVAADMAEEELTR